MSKRRGNWLRLTGTQKYFASMASVYRLLRARSRITGPAFFVRKAANDFKNATKESNQLWRADLICMSAIGGARFDLSTLPGDFSHYVTSASNAQEPYPARKRIAAPRSRSPNR